MNIEISQELLKRAISEVVAGGIERGVASYEIKSKIADYMSEQEQQRWAEISRELMPSEDATDAHPAL